MVLKPESLLRTCGLSDSLACCATSEQKDQAAGPFYGIGVVIGTVGYNTRENEI
jgi:hypothetical protein